MLLEVLKHVVRSPQSCALSVPRTSKKRMEHNPGNKDITKHRKAQPCHTDVVTDVVFTDAVTYACRNYRILATMDTRQVMFHYTFVPQCFSAQLQVQRKDTVSSTLYQVEMWKQYSCSAGSLSCFLGNVAVDFEATKVRQSRNESPIAMARKEAQQRCT